MNTLQLQRKKSFADSKQMAHHSKSDSNQTPGLYLHEYFNVNILQAGKSDVAVGRILNGLIDELNTSHILPKYLVIIIDSDVIEDLNIFEFGVHKGLALNVNWLAKQVDLTLRCKRLQNREKCPGSVIADLPKVIYVMMIRRIECYPDGSRMTKLCTLCNKFNDLLNEAMARRNGHILSIRSLNLPQHFDKFGNLSTVGKEAFWIEMDELIEKFDHDRIKLEPRPHNKFDISTGPASIQVRNNNDLRKTIQRDAPSRVSYCRDNHNHRNMDNYSSFTRRITGILHSSHQWSKNRFVLPRLHDRY